MSDTEDKLIDHMKELWAGNVALYIKVHGFHINVEGHKFYETHKLFQKIYEFYQGEIDSLGEAIRTLDEIVPASLSRIEELSEIKDEKEVPDYVGMYKITWADIETLRDRAGKAFRRADDEQRYGLQNILADYLQQCEKFQWMLNASSKEVDSHKEDDTDAQGDKQGKWKPQKI
jgi:starvation-inducible DNA-binding protein